MTEQKKKSQLELRYERLSFIYQALLLDFSLEEINDQITKLNDENDREFLTNWTGYINSIPSLVSAHIKQGWSWQRLDYLVKALFHLILTEAKYYKTDKPILISQAIKLLESYGDDKAIKLVTAVLNKVL
ncbi:DUF1948 domain-containing protein [Mycoplasma sp. E35C]|uniref:DUF1948 domain-containing protein n=1 Tax=Mycoplasma sp. E35C TaxID=2801918 RepID=UPI001CA453DE|nr:DUF1948 domain-containing protein [Mycoplasma sp. E35C]QZX48942.1 DUF1948 domain-containing protein [Mycoplasma sp. E35C]